MIDTGILLLVIGIVIWGIARVVATPAFLLILGEVIGAIGLVLLLVGLVLLVIPTLHGGINSMAQIWALTA